MVCVNRKVPLRFALLSAISMLAVLPAAAEQVDPVAPTGSGQEPQGEQPGTAQLARAGSEILVSARKRQESILEVPVVVTALPAEQLDRLQVTDMQDIPRLVPGLVLGGNLLSIGLQPALRGVGTSSSDPGVDQSVSLNIDGLSLGHGLAFTSGMFDLGQIEVLKGPQALFYGKSSPGGVISLRTADPTDQFEVITRGGYEFEGNETRGEVILSGPASDTLGVRFAGMYTEGDGYFKNSAVAAPGTGAANPYRRETRPRSWIIRGTALWNPTDTFSARFKVNFVHDRAIDAEAAQLKSCPEGAGQLVPPLNIPFIGGDDCRLDRDLHVVYMDPAYFPGIPNGGVPYLENDQEFGTLELNYDLTPTLGLTSTTGYYKLRSDSLVNTHHSTAAGPVFAFTNAFSRREFTEELRLNSDFEGPWNFTLGAFYQDASLNDRVTSLPNIAYPFLQVTDGVNTVDIKTYSIFGQARWEIVPDVELAGGARWTDETRRQTPINLLTGQAIPVQVREISSSNIAPEATVTYTPTEDLTLFAAYKRAFKSGSFSVATIPLPNANNAFDDEKVKGGEVGVKARLLDRQLLVNAAVYDYRYTGLQVGAVEPTETQPIIRTVNAGRARTYGVDFDASFRPIAIEGFGLNASVNWNRGRYKVLNSVPCYAGQTIGLGCTLLPNPVTGRFSAQDLSGTPLIRAPEWQATFGFDYELPVGSDMALTFTSSNQFSSKFVTLLAASRPNNDHYQKSFLKADLSLALRGPDDRWEVALIGKNVTDKITASNCTASNFAGGLIFGDIAGAPQSGVAGLAETGCYTERGRSVWVRLTLKPFQ
jgi:iron complex outermembrane receptor protein